MTEQQIDLEIAWAMGLRWERSEKNDKQTWYSIDRFTRDLNALSRAAIWLSLSQPGFADQFVSEVRKVYARLYAEDASDFALTHATMEVRYEAMLRVLGKWEDNGEAKPPPAKARKPTRAPTIEVPPVKLPTREAVMEYGKAKDATYGLFYATLFWTKWEKAEWKKDGQPVDWGKEFELGWKEFAAEKKTFVSEKQNAGGALPKEPDNKGFAARRKEIADSIYHIRANTANHMKNADGEVVLTPEALSRIADLRRQERDLASATPTK